MLQHRLAASISVLLIAFAVGGAESVFAQAPMHVYLTWQGSTSNTMTVNAQTDAAVDAVRVYYDTRARHGDDNAYRYQAQGQAHRIDGLADGRWVHWIELTGLSPDSTYYFIVGSESSGFSTERAFRTVPADGRPLRFVTGGDLGVGEDVHRLLRHAAAYSPYFALIGGDLAYVNGNLDAVGQWDDWLDAWGRLMVTPDGWTIPMVLAVGNHEVQGGYEGGPARAPFYMGFFAQPGRPSYFRQQLGANAVVYVLDTGHIVTHEAQVEWLTEQLERDTDIPYRFAIYHIPLYPSHRDYDGSHSELGRRHWRPLFDRYRLTTAFENHDHTFKRSKLLRNGEAEPDGTLYLGDGAWGRGDRTIDVTTPSYLDKAGANRHVWVVDVSSDGVTYRAFDLEGKIFDVYPTDMPEAAQAEAYFRTMPQLYGIDEEALVVEPLEARYEGFEEAEVRATVRNTEGYPARIAVRLEVEPPLTTPSPAASMRLDPGDSADVSFDLTATAPIVGDLFPDAVLWADFAFLRTTAGAQADTVHVSLAKRIAVEREFSAPRLTRPLVLDGQFDDWDDLPYRFEVAAPHDVDTGNWYGAEDASLRFGIVHDSTQLYLAFDVTDDDIVHKPGTPVWDAGHERATQDALLMWLDPHPGGEGDDDPYLAIAPGDEPGAAHLVAADDDYLALARAARVAATRSGQGYRIELAVPLAALGADGPLAAVRINLALNDVDELGSTSDLIFWRPEWESDRDFAGFGVVTLK